MRSTPRMAALLGVIALLAASACSTGGDRPLQFGIRRLALDIAFTDGEGLPPADPEVVVRRVPVPSEVLEPGFDFSSVTIDTNTPLDLGQPAELCPSAPPEATILLPASPAIIDPPKPGTYLRRNSGWIEVTGAGLGLRIPYPFISTWEISRAAPVARPGPLGVPGSATARQFTVTKRLTEAFKVKETYEVGAEALLLVERVTTADGVQTRFRTDPPLEVFRYGAEGDSWVSAGADLDQGFGVVIEARIGDRDVIDVCGDLIDTFRIEYDEQVVNLRTGETFGTDQSQQSILNIAPQYGGLIVREQMHAIQRTSTRGGTPFVVRFDYESTLLSITP